MGFSYLGLDSSSDLETGTFKDSMLVLTYRYAQLFDVNFYLNYSASDTPLSTQTIAATHLLSYVSNPNREGYTFKGWNTLVDGTGQMWTFDTDVMPFENLDLYAQWSINQYQLNFNLNGGEGSTPTSQDVVFGSLASQPSIPKREGYTFKGWNTFVDGKGSTFDFINTTMPARDVTLYAQWSVNQYQLSFYLNGGEGNTPTTQNVNFNSLAKQPSKPKREGYTFKGWNTLVDGKGSTFDFINTTMPAQDVTLYAQWTKNGLPKTGDSSNTILLSGLLILTGTTLIVINKRRFLK